MGKAAKSARALKRKREKAGRKSANAARYAAMRDAGINSKSKRNQLKTKRKTALRVKRNKGTTLSSERQAKLDYVSQLIQQSKQRRKKAEAIAAAERKQRKAAKVAKNAAVWAACGRTLACSVEQKT